MLLQLPANKGAYETGGSDQFSLTTPPLGTIAALTIGHNNKGIGAAWCLSRVDLHNTKTGARRGLEPQVEESSANCSRHYGVWVFRELTVAMTEASSTRPCGRCVMPCRAGEMYEFNFQNAWMDSKRGLSRTLAPTSYRIGGPTGGRAPTMPAAEEGKANYVMEIATGRGHDGWVPCTVPQAAGSLRP